MEDKMDKKITEENLEKVSGGCDIDDAMAGAQIKCTPGGNGLGIKGNPLEDMPPEHWAKGQAVMDALN